MRYWIIFLIMCGGCAGSCISLGGSYDGKYSGNIEYCFDAAESEKAGVVAFDTGNGEKVYSFDEEIIQGLLDKLKDKIGIKSAENEAKHPVKELMELMEEKP